TLCPVYSATKPIGALVVATLVERGKLDYDAPVADYWPEFAANGKGAYTVAEALSHQAGAMVVLAVSVIHLRDMTPLSRPHAEAS
nr:serine hydrolase domain-containing protein [Pyrinomonadaceae bacterium]